MEPEIRIETITPSQAQRILETQNTHNRNVRTRRVEGFARAMKAGEWKLNGDAIRFDRDGMLLDGQHRLAACVKAGTAIRTLVVHGLPRDVMPTVDTGSRRSIADVLRLRHERYASRLASSVSACVRIDNSDTIERAFSRRDGVENHEVLAWLEANPGIRELVARADAGLRGRAPSLHSMVVPAMWAILKCAPRELSALYVRKVITGEDDGRTLRASDPANRVREAFADMLLKRAKHHRMYQYGPAAVVCYGWNATRRGQAPSRLTTAGFPSTILGSP